MCFDESFGFMHNGNERGSILLEQFSYFVLCDFSLTMPPELTHDGEK